MNTNSNLSYAETYSDEKLHIFSKHVFAQAMSERDKILTDLEQRMSEARNQAETDCYENAYKKIQKGKERILRTANEQLSRVQLEGKKQIALKRGEIIEQVFNGVRKCLTDFMAGEDYYSWLLGCAKSALAEVSDGKGSAKDITVYLNASDSAHAEKLGSDCGYAVKVLEPHDNIIGGVRAVNTTRRVVCNDTFAARLEREKAEFVVA